LKTKAKRTREGTEDIQILFKPQKTQKRSLPPARIERAIFAYPVDTSATLYHLAKEAIVEEWQN
jgi:hypothetical protein